MMWLVMSHSTVPMFFGPFDNQDDAEEFADRQNRIGEDTFTAEELDEPW